MKFQGYLSSSLAATLVALSFAEAQMFYNYPSTSGEATVSPAIAQNSMTRRPTPAPTSGPTTGGPIIIPIPSITRRPTVAPTENPTVSPSKGPTKEPSESPSPKPTQVPTNLPTTVAPTEKATKSPTIAPTDKATEDPTIAPTNRATKSPTVAPTDVPTIFTQLETQEPTIEVTTRNITAVPSLVPTQIPSYISTALGTDMTLSSSPTPSPTQPPTKGDPKPSVALVDQLKKMAIQFEVTFSLWAPEGIPKSGSEFEPISAAVLTSIRKLYCEDPFASVCVLKDDTLLTSKEIFVARQAKTVAKYKTMAMLGIARVTAVEGDTFAYTSWEISFEMIQLGIQYVQEMIEKSEKPQIDSIDDLKILIRQNIERKVTLDVEKSIREGTFDGLLHSELGRDKIVSAVPGEEYDTFSLFLPKGPASNPPIPESGTSGVGDDPDLPLVAIYVAIAVVIIVFTACVLVLFYYVQRHTNNRNSQADVEQRTAKEEESTSSADDALPEARPVPAISSPSVTTDSDLENQSIGAASYQRKPARFVLQPDTESEQPDDSTGFPTAGSLVAGSVVPGSLMAESVESSLDGWSVHAAEINWS